MGDTRPIRCVIVDDEPLAVALLADYVSKTSGLQVVLRTTHVLEALQAVQEDKADLLFLDIQMPELTGLQLMKIIGHKSKVIVTTAYPDYALDGYTFDVIDYLLKPITFDRFFKAANKANDYFNLVNSTPVNSGDYFFIKCDSKYERIYFKDILFVQAWENYINIFTTKKKYLTLLNLKSVEENLDKQFFIKVHKSFIVSIDKIDAIENNDLIIQNSRIPVSRNLKDAVIERVVNKRLWKKG